MEPSSSIIYALDNLRHYIFKVYGKSIQILTVNNPGVRENDNELYGRYLSEIFSHFEDEEVAMLLHRDGYTYLNYPHLDVEVCFTPSVGCVRSQNMVLTGECDEIDLKSMFPNVIFSKVLHKKDDKLVSLVQYTLRNQIIMCEALGPFPSQ